PAHHVSHLYPGHALHLTVNGEYIDAGVPALVDDVIEEVAADDALAHEAPERVGKHGQDGVDVALLDELRESLAIEPPRHDADSSVPAGPVSRSPGPRMAAPERGLARLYLAQERRQHQHE